MKENKLDLDMIRQNLIHKFDQQEEQVRDNQDRRWIQCEVCGKIDPDQEFAIYGGVNRLNLGICSNCYRKKEVNRAARPFL